MPTSDDETVPVRVKDLEYVAVVLEGHKSITALGMVREYLPKPRLVQVDLAELMAVRDKIAIGKPSWSVLDDLIEKLAKQA
jgi:hypothetical protein